MIGLQALTTKICRLVLLLLCCSSFLSAEDGYRLWLRYDRIGDPVLLREYREAVQGYTVLGDSETLQAAQQELNLGLSGLLDKGWYGEGRYQILAGKAAELPISAEQVQQVKALGPEGYALLTTETHILITANTDIGVLYGVFHFLRLLQTHQNIDQLDILEAPQLDIRILNHWDNLDRTVERGYAGFSIWNWHTLPDYIDQRYIDYARANASIGINGTVVTNVNSNALVLRADYLEKVKALADVLRPYGLKIYLTARFSAPIELGGLKTADPLDPTVQQWWQKKVDEIYRYVPDFGGFVVKANSEGQPGPQNYKRNHADGANMLA
ncbi:MAG: alpha-glucuronidase, partial [Phaeodactylibacter sp.]|nr:alpha-glucuronidase [Phaeodactylibacter sp.]